jgi:PKD repeat protein
MLRSNRTDSSHYHLYIGTFLLIFFCGCGEEKSSLNLLPDDGVLLRDSGSGEISEDLLATDHIPLGSDLGPGDSGLLFDLARDGAHDASDAPHLPPVSLPGGDVSSQAGVPILFDGSASYDPDGEVVSFDWAFGNGDHDTGANLAYTFTDAGEFIVTLTVTDDDGLTGSDFITATIAPANEGPDAVIDGPTQVVSGEEAEFNAYLSEDDHGVAGYFWDVGLEEEEPIEGVELLYTWPEWGEVTLTLTVEDHDGLTDSATRLLPVWSRPFAVIEGHATAYQGEEVEFDGSLSYDLDGTIESWLYTFPDGSTSNAIFSRYSFDSLGDQEVFLTVTDNDGLSDTTNYKLFIEEPPNQCPVAVLDDPIPAFDIYSLTSVQFSASGSTDTDGEIVSYLWDFGDSTPAEVGTDTITHTFTDNGIFLVSVILLDEDGCTYHEDDPLTHQAKDTYSVGILNTPPTAVLEASPTVVTLGEAIYFNASDSDDPDGSIETYLLEMDDGRSWALSAVTYTYETTGSYTVTLTVTDDDGDEGTTTVDVIVEADEDPPDDEDEYSGLWEVSPTLSYRCAGSGGGSYYVDLSIEEFVIIQTGDSVEVTPNPLTSPPGSLLGTMVSDTRLIASSIFGEGDPFACVETYTVDVTFTDADHFSGMFTANYSPAVLCGFLAPPCEGYAHAIEGIRSE